MNTPDLTPDFTTEDLHSLRATVERFAREAIAPHVPVWEETGQFDRSLYTQAAQLGLLGLGYPENLGGTPVPWRARNAMSQTLARYSGSGGVMASLFSLNIGLPPVMAHGSAELQAEVVPPVPSSPNHAAIVCVVAAEPLSPADYRERLAGYTSLVHVSVEVNRSPGAVDTPA
jgi:acyl-CoA dehydrogenase